MRSTRLVITLFFFADGLLLGLWASRIPGVQAQAGLTNTGLGLALFASSLGALVAMPIAGLVCERVGSTASSLCPLSWRAPDCSSHPRHLALSRSPSDCSGSGRVSARSTLQRIRRASLSSGCTVAPFSLRFMPRSARWDDRGRCGSAGRARGFVTARSHRRPGGSSDDLGASARPAIAPGSRR